MKLKTFFFATIFFICSAISWGQTWNLSPTMKATLDAAGVLTVSTTASAEAIPDGVPPWRDYAADVKKVVIKDGIINIGSGAFSYCPALTSVSIPKSLTNYLKSATGNPIFK